jgi:hypothetical protein
MNVQFGFGQRPKLRCPGFAGRWLPDGHS